MLDNCEQIISPTAGLCRDLLTACPNLRVLATSRERLGVAGESLYRVPSLSLPDENATVEEANRHDAVRLFVERSQLASSEFAVTPENVEAVVSICRHLDGIPLALELAAALTRSLSPAQILDRLDERFRLLTAADRNAEGRQQTLLSTIEWSHDLLGPDERLLFRRLGVFAANFSLSSSERICSGDGIDEYDVTDLLMALVDKSMVTTDSARDGTTRYILLETIREFARRQLDEAGERAVLAQRHAEHYAELAAQLQAQQPAPATSAARWPARPGRSRIQSVTWSHARRTTAHHRRSPGRGPRLPVVRRRSAPRRVAVVRRSVRPRTRSCRPGARRCTAQPGESAGRDG